MKKLLVFLICMMMAVAVVPASEVHAAKAKPKLSVKSKTLTVGKTYKIKLKNSGSKVKWKSSKKSVVSIQKKKGNVVTVKAKKPGKATITATYKKKKYKCKITDLKNRTAKYGTSYDEEPAEGVFKEGDNLNDGINITFYAGTKSEYTERVHWNYENNDSTLILIDANGFDWKFQKTSMSLLPDCFK